MKIPMKKHEYVDQGQMPMPDLAPNWRGFVCKHCGHVSGLDAWQVENMPESMAACPRGVPASIKERLVGNYDCLAA